MLARAVRLGQAEQAGAGDVLQPGEQPHGHAHARRRASRRHCPGSLTSEQPAQQIAELEETIEKTPCDLVLVGTPIDLTRVLKIGKPAARVRYELEPLVPTLLEEEIRKVVR